MRFSLSFALIFVCLTPTQTLCADETASKHALLKRIYNARLQLERDRAQADNEARANVRLISAERSPATADAPTVTTMREDTYVKLARFEQNFRCLDVDVDNNGGNTVVICGSNSGDIDGSNVNAGRDLIVPRNGG